jgi:biopolymer transport protein ExbD
MPVKLQGSDDHEEDARIEVVPLIDIMFFLLASFMLVSISMTNISRVDLKLPTSTTSVPEIKTPPIHIAVDANGIMTWDTQIVTATEITDRLLALPPDPETKVMIAADEESRHKQVIALMDAIKAAKIDRISFETKSANP